MFRLGTGRGTKSGREQFALLRVSEHPNIWHLLERAIRLTPSGARIFPYTVSTATSWFQKAQDAIGINVGATAHSPRAGFATDAIAAGRPAFEVKEAGRWVSESSFRLYIDLIGAQSVAVQLRVNHRAAAVTYLLDHLEEYFPDWALACYGGATRSHTSAAASPASHRGRGRGRGRSHAAPRQPGEGTPGCGVGRGATARGRQPGAGGRGR